MEQWSPRISVVVTKSKGVTWMSLSLRATDDEYIQKQSRWDGKRVLIWREGTSPTTVEWIGELTGVPFSKRVYRERGTRKTEKWWNLYGEAYALASRVLEGEDCWERLWEVGRELVKGRRPRKDRKSAGVKGRREWTRKGMNGLGL